MDEGETLVLEATEKPWGPNYLRFGMSLEDDFSGNSDFSLAFRYTQTGFERLGTEWRTDLRIGGAPSLATEFYRPLSVGAAPFFLAARAAVGQRDLTRVDGSRSLQRFRITEYGGSLAFGQELGRSAQWRMGFRIGAGEGELKLGAPDPAFGDAFDIDRGDIFLGFELDTLDQISFPRTGNFLRVEWAQAQSGLGADDGAERLEFNWTHARSYGAASILANIDYRTALEPGSGSSRPIHARRIPQYLGNRARSFGRKAPWIGAANWLSSSWVTRAEDCSICPGTSAHRLRWATSGRIEAISARMI